MNSSDTPSVLESRLSELETALRRAPGLQLGELKELLLLRSLQWTSTAEDADEEDLRPF